MTMQEWRIAQAEKQKKKEKVVNLLVANRKNVTKILINIESTKHERLKLTRPRGLGYMTPNLTKCNKARSTSDHHNDENVKVTRRALHFIPPPGRKREREREIGQERTLAPARGRPLHGSPGARPSVLKDAKTRVYRNGGSFVDGRYDDERERWYRREPQHPRARWRPLHRLPGAPLARPKTPRPKYAEKGRELCGCKM